jgi:hypothetical protein
VSKCGTWSAATGSADKLGGDGGVLAVTVGAGATGAAGAAAEVARAGGVVGAALVAGGTDPAVMPAATGGAVVTGAAVVDDGALDNGELEGDEPVAELPVGGAAHPTIAHARAPVATVANVVATMRAMRFPRRLVCAE